MNLLLPGLRNSGPNHWQSIWQQQYPHKFVRVNQRNWNKPNRQNWVEELDRVANQFILSELILIGHSVGCATIVHWLAQTNVSVKGVLLVAPSDVESPAYPTYITGFAPLPLQPIAVPAIVVASSNDPVVSLERARYFAQCWGSQFQLLHNAGHIEDKSGYGSWPQGLEFLSWLEANISR